MRELYLNLSEDGKMLEEIFSFSGMKILIVDDSPSNLEFFYSILTEEGFELSTASGGEDALKIASSFLPDLILLDVMMPGIDGFETCSRLKDNETTMNIPIIFLTGKTQPKDIIKGFSVGGVDYIAKPFHPVEALARIETHLLLKKRTEELRSSNEKLQKYTEALKRSNKELEEFASISSHDLQEPLRKIIYFGNMLKQQFSNLDDKGLDYIGRMQSAANRMNSYIVDLLNYSHVTLNTKPYPVIHLQKIAEEILGDLETRISETKGTVHLGHLPSLQADPFQMRQLLQNLISNALKFHKNGVPPIVDVNSHAGENGEWKIMIKDNGIGIDERHVDQVFKPFKRLNKRSDYAGSGLGLAICKKIMDLHKGKLEIKSNAPDGSIFVITLPQKQTT